MPLFLSFAIIAVVVALFVISGRRSDGRGRRFVGTAAAVWVILAVMAIVALTVATLIFGR